MQLQLAEVAALCHCPALFIHAKDDALVPATQSRDLFEAFSSTEKSYLLVDGTHNSLRGATARDAASALLFEHLLLPQEQRQFGTPLTLVPTHVAQLSHPVLTCTRVTFAPHAPHAPHTGSSPMESEVKNPTDFRKLSTEHLRQFLQERGVTA